MVPLEFPASGRIAAVDYGTARVGIAVCDPDRILASPLSVLSSASWPSEADGWREADGWGDDVGSHTPETSVLESVRRSFKQIAAEERLCGWVVGLPIHADGNESASSKLSRAFARWLQSQTQLPTRLFDERFTTVDAQSRMRGSGWTLKKRKKRVDAIAATVLLEAFLEASRYGGEHAGTEIHLDANPEEKVSSPPSDDSLKSLEDRPES
ncbi:MAG: Holliday junction resolvase RuvX [Planctomycetota bacterium]